jgi:hypothetical protein
VLDSLPQSRKSHGPAKKETTSYAATAFGCTHQDDSEHVLSIDRCAASAIAPSFDAPFTQRAFASIE